MSELATLLDTTDELKKAFPVVGERIFMAHAGVAPLSAVARDAMVDFAEKGAMDAQEGARSWQLVKKARSLSAEILGCGSDEISLLGPTSLGLNLVALGLDWAPGDEVVYYEDDYPANVYPWQDLERKGVRPVALRTKFPGVITWECIEEVVGDRTKLVSLASCNFLTGYRIDIDRIGRELRKRNVLFSIDGIQTIGAFETPVEHVDFLSADAHKWMLGPAAAGMFYVRNACRERLRPRLIGSWNVVSPDFVSQSSIAFEEGGRRYEPGTLNHPGIAGMEASLALLLGFGIPSISARLLCLRECLLKALRPLGFVHCLEEWDTRADATDAERSSIVSVRHPAWDRARLTQRLIDAKVSVSWRLDRTGTTWLRLSPHFYNTEDEVQRVAELLKI